MHADLMPCPTTFMMCAAPMMDPVPKAVAVQVIVLVALFGAAYAQTVTFAPLTSTAVGEATNI